MFRLVHALALAAALSAVATAGASAPPVGQLPPGPVTTIQTNVGQLVAVALPHRAKGLTWRLAKGYDPKVVVEVGEADVGPNVVVIYRTTGAGRISLAYGLTRGETTGASESLRFDVISRR